MNTRLSAMILTGGASRRFGSDKSQALLGQRTLVENLLATLPEEMAIVIVGPELPEPSRTVRYAQEHPLGGGPVAAIDAGLRLIDTELVAIIATDMPFASQILGALIERILDLKDALIPLDSQGVRQPLCAIYRKESLSRALAVLGRVQGQSVRRMIEILEVEELSLEPNLRRILLDVDTPSDLERAIDLIEQTQGNEGVHSMDKWIEAVQKELGLDVVVDQELILDLARDAAHGVERKAAPITTFLLGIAIAGGADPKEAAKGIAELAGRWPTDK